MRKMKGGTTSLGPQYTNPITSFGDTGGSISSAAILNSTGTLNHSPYVNSNLYNTNTPALV
jgi:hypothetical protein